MLVHIDSLAHFDLIFQQDFSVSSHVINRIHPKHSNCPTSNLNPIPIFICRNCVAFSPVFVFDCIFRFNFSYLSLFYGHGVVMVFCSSWHRSCSVVK